MSARGSRNLLAIGVALIGFLAETGRGNRRRGRGDGIASGLQVARLVDRHVIRGGGGNRQALLLIHIGLQNPLELNRDWSAFQFDSTKAGAVDGCNTSNAGKVMLALFEIALIRLLAETRRGHRRGSRSDAITT